MCQHGLNLAPSAFCIVVCDARIALTVVCNEALSPSYSVSVHSWGPENRGLPGVLADGTSNDTPGCQYIESTDLF